MFLYITLFISFYFRIHPTFCLNNSNATATNYSSVSTTLSSYRTTTTTSNSTTGFSILNTTKYIDHWQRHYNTWNMVQALGKTYDATMWTLHFKPSQDPSWKKCWHRDRSKPWTERSIHALDPAHTDPVCLYGIRRPYGARRAELV